MGPRQRIFGKKYLSKIHNSSYRYMFPKNENAVLRSWSRFFIGRSLEPEPFLRRLRLHLIDKQKIKALFLY